jgi:2-octaprenyl-6-methoxyphenol hydroxylase
MPFDGRASAITASARRMFEALGVWQQVAQHAQSMDEIIVTDSARPGDARPVLLQFDAGDMRGQPSSHMIENRFSAAPAEPGAGLSHHHLRNRTEGDDYNWSGPASVQLADGQVLRPR